MFTVSSGQRHKEVRTNHGHLCCSCSLHPCIMIQSSLWIQRNPLTQFHPVLAVGGRLAHLPTLALNCWGVDWGTFNKLLFKWHNTDVYFSTFMLTCPYCSENWGILYLCAVHRKTLGMEPSSTVTTLSLLKWKMYVFVCCDWLIN